MMPFEALYDTSFTDDNDAAFSNLMLLEYTGYFIFFISAPYLIVRTSLILLLISLSISTARYIAFEVYERKERKKIATMSENNNRF